MVVVSPLTGSLPLAERDESGLFTFCCLRGEGLKEKNRARGTCKFFSRMGEAPAPRREAAQEPSDFRGGRWWDATWDLRGQIPDPSALPSAGTKFFA